MVIISVSLGFIVESIRTLYFKWMSTITFFPKQLIRLNRVLKYSIVVSNH